MNPETKMLASLISKSLNLGPEWTVTGVEMRECAPEPDELHVRVRRRSRSSTRCAAG